MASSTNNTPARSEEMDPFLLKAIQHPRDRFLVLQLDQQFERFIKNPSQTQLEFPSMNSYQRMIVHKVAQYFGMIHTVDRVKKSVTVFKQKDSSIPLLRLSDINAPQEDKHKKVVLLKRPHSKENGNKDNIEYIKENEIVEDREDRGIEQPNNVVQSKLTSSNKGQKYRIKTKNSKEYDQVDTPENNAVISLTKTHLTTVPTILTKVTNTNLIDPPVLNSKDMRNSKATKKTMEEREEEYLKARARIFADSEKLEWSPEMDNPVANDSDEDKIFYEDHLSVENDQDYSRKLDFPPVEPVSYPSGKQLFPVNPQSDYIPHRNYQVANNAVPLENFEKLFNTGLPIANETNKTQQVWPHYPLRNNHIHPQHLNQLKNTDISPMNPLQMQNRPIPQSTGINLMYQQPRFGYYPPSYNPGYNWEYEKEPEPFYQEEIHAPDLIHGVFSNADVESNHPIYPSLDLHRRPHVLPNYNYHNIPSYHDERSVNSRNVHLMMPSSMYGIPQTQTNINIRPTNFNEIPTQPHNYPPIYFPGFYQQNKMNTNNMVRHPTNMNPVPEPSTQFIQKQNNKQIPKSKQVKTLPNGSNMNINNKGFAPSKNTIETPKLNKPVEAEPTRIIQPQINKSKTTTTTIITTTTTTITTTEEVSPQNSSGSNCKNLGNQNQ